MASVQQVRNEAQFSEKEKVAIDEALNDAKSFHANNNNNCNNAKVASQYQLARVVASIKDTQMLSRSMMLYKSHSFTGDFVCKPPRTIGPHDSGRFLHEGATWLGDLPMVVGSKGAVVYAHCDNLLNALGWILAWDKPDNENTDSKVFVAAGPRDEILKMEWNEIAKKLDESCTSYMCVFTPSGATACGKIDNEQGKLALLGAHFGQSGATNT